MLPLLFPLTNIREHGKIVLLQGNLATSGSVFTLGTVVVKGQGRRHNFHLLSVDVAKDCSDLIEQPIQGDGDCSQMTAMYNLTEMECFA
jgi:hypothetical protein